MRPSPDVNTFLNFCRENLQAEEGRPYWPQGVRMLSKDPYVYLGQKMDNIAKKAWTDFTSLLQVCG